MRNKIKAALLTLAIVSVGAQGVTVLAAPETAFVSETDFVSETAENTVENTVENTADSADGADFTDHAAIEELRQKKEQAAEKKAKEKAEAKAAELKKTREELVEFALQFEGNPYVYGGTSLTNGADCSGFVMSVFKEFGYELPRVAADQLNAAEQKAVEDIEPGDLLFYGNYGIDHVALYIGDGKIIHASTSATGIKISDYNYREPAAAGNYIK